MRDQQSEDPLKPDRRLMDISGLYRSSDVGSEPDPALIDVGLEPDPGLIDVGSEPDPGLIDVSAGSICAAIPDRNQNLVRISKNCSR